MRSISRGGWTLIALAALALVVRVAAALVWQARLPAGEPFAFPDSESYWGLGQAIAGGATYEFSGSRAFRTPGYPALLAPLFMVFGDRPPVIAARMVGAVLGTATVLGVSCLAWKLFDEKAALIGAALAALYPGAIAMSILVLSEALFCPLMIGGLLLWVIAWQTDKRKHALMYAAAAGAVSGLAVLTRPSWLLFVPLAVVVSVVVSKTRMRSLMIGGAVLTALVVTMSPWWVRNAYVLHAFVPTTTQVGASLYDGLHEGATGASEMSFVPCVEKDFRARGGQRDEVALNRHFTNQAVIWTRENPGRAAHLAGIKFIRTWNIWPNEAGLRSWTVRLAVAVGYVPILVFGLIGAAMFSRRGWPYVLCWLPAVYFSLLHVVFVGSIRYRQPAVLVLVVLAAGCIPTLWEKWKE